MSQQPAKNTSENVAAPEPQEDIENADQTPDSAEPSSVENIKDILDEQDQEAEEFAVKFLTSVLRLRGVRIEREQFLKTELHKRGLAQDQITLAIDGSPAAAGVTPLLLDEIARAAIEFERNRSSTISFAAGVPGGSAFLATVPVDITQFYIHVFRIMQKLAYLYGWKSFLEDTEQVDDETLGMLSGFLGVMMGVAGATGSVRHFALKIARPAVEKKIANVALMKTAWYLPMKQTLRVVGIQVTKQTFARTVTKVIPVVGGVVSGSVTYVAFNTQAKRLMQYLRELPPPNVDAAEYLATVKDLDDTPAEQGDRKETSAKRSASGRYSAKRIAQVATPMFKNAGSAIGGKLKVLRRSGRSSSASREEAEDD